MSDHPAHCNYTSNDVEWHLIVTLQNQKLSHEWSECKSEPTCKLMYTDIERQMVSKHKSSDWVSSNLDKCLRSSVQNSKQRVQNEKPLDVICKIAEGESKHADGQWCKADLKRELSSQKSQDVVHEYCHNCIRNKVKTHDNAYHVMFKVQSLCLFWEIRRVEWICEKCEYIVSI